MGWTLITGGAKRLGKEIALKLKEEGHQLLVHYLSSEKSAKTIGEKSVQGDFSTITSTQAFIDRLLEVQLPIAHIVHTVGCYTTEPLLTTTPETWQRFFQINLFAPLAITQALLPSLKRAKGSVVAIGVSGLDNRADRNFSAYRLSKLALLRSIRNLAKELAPSGVQVNMVSPGQLAGSIDAPKDPKEIPMGKLGENRDVAGLIAFLMHHENHYITGQNIEVAGGLAL